MVPLIFEGKKYIFILNKISKKKKKSKISFFRQERLNSK
jgi:hypothetical protein